MRSGTAIVLGVLLLLILGAALIQFVLMGKNGAPAVSPDGWPCFLPRLHPSPMWGVPWPPQDFICWAGSGWPQAS